ncbi:ATP-binding protein [Streptomyces bambusae]|uniref:ATP-binding protein n=1 Tax=Streptomyces bambusae TaxID=1550616 RepID=UPI0027DF1429|nr:ATP-binding protein [Streptomyces bambusae]
MNLNTQPALLRERLFARCHRSVPRARAFTAETLDVWDVPWRRDDMLLCVSELATNALRHGVPPGRGFRVRLLRFEDVVRIEVHDSGPGLSRVRLGVGLGLEIVAAVADEWGAVPRSPGKVVWAELGLAASPAHRPPRYARALLESIAELEAGQGEPRALIGAARVDGYAA